VSNLRENVARTLHEAAFGTDDEAGDTKPYVTPLSVGFTTGEQHFLVIETNAKGGRPTGLVVKVTIQYAEHE
jgi:hypothetical protein